MTTKSEKSGNLCCNCCIVTALILSIIATFLIATFFKAMKLNHMIQLTESEMRNSHRFPIPKVVMMNKVGQGHLFTLKQNKNLTFELDWSFKLPKTSLHDPLNLNIVDSGHYLFEDQGQIFAIPSNMNQKMTILQPPTNRHYTIQNREIPEKFYLAGKLVRTGYFIMIFGGYSRWILDEWYTTISCSSSKGSKSSTAIWSIKKRVWIKGPHLPTKGDKCFIDASGFAINQTHAALLVISQDSSDTGKSTSCIEAFVYSFETMVWVDKTECFIDLGLEIFSVKESDVSLTSTTFFNKQGKLMAVIQFKGYGIWVYAKKWYLSDYHTQQVQLIQQENEFNLKSQPMFTLQNIVYMASFSHEYAGECQDFYGAVCVNKIQISSLIQNGTLNHTFAPVQTLHDENLKHFISRHPKMISLPFQTSHSRLRHYKSVPIKDL